MIAKQLMQLEPMRWPARRLMRWNVASVIAGGIAWVTLALLRLTGGIGVNDLTLILLLALLVLVPLAIPLAALAPGDGETDIGAALAIVLQSMAALGGSLALLAGTGSILAALGAVVWFLFTALLGGVGLARLARLLQRRGLPLPELCLAVALVYLPIGGAWFLLSRLGIRPLGFSATTVLLTAVHFHVITLAAILMTGLTGTALRATRGGMAQRLYSVAAAGMLVFPLLVALGITVTQLTGNTIVESSSATLLALSLLLVTVLGLRYVLPATPALFARALLVIANLAVVATMLLAAAYALGRTTGAWTITIDQMVTSHGWLNALAFGVCGVLGWRLRAARDAQTAGG
jgi:YndJ-like protein